MPRFGKNWSGGPPRKLRSVNGQIEFLLREAIARRKSAGELTKQI